MEANLFGRLLREFVVSSQEVAGLRRERKKKERHLLLLQPSAGF